MREARPIAMPRAAVEVDHAHVFFPGSVAPVVDIEHLRIVEGERVAVLGPSGAGKTTLLRMLNARIRPSAGRVRVLDRELDARKRMPRAARRQVGFVFQSFNLVDRATVLGNVLCGRLGHLGPASLLGVFPKRDREAAYAALEEVELAGKADRRADTLSGGEQQRVGIARVIAQAPRLLLADEPVSNLDPELADEILELIVAAAARRGTTLITTLHVPEQAQRYSGRVLGMRRGRLVCDCAASELGSERLRRIYGRSEVALPALDAGVNSVSTSS